MHKIVPTLALIGSIALSGLIAACGGSASTAPSPNGTSQSAAAPSGAPVKLTVGVAQVSPGFLPLWIARDAGIYARNGLDVDVRVATSTTGMAALLSGDVNFQVGGGAELVNAAAGGANVLALANIASVSAFKLEVASAIKTKDDLVGKKVGISRFGSTTDIGMRALLRKVGLNPEKDVTFVQLNDNAGITGGLLSGNVQAALMTPPQTLKVEAQGMHPLYELAKLNVPDTTAILITTRPWLNAHHDAAQRFMDSVIQAIVRERQDKPLTIATLKKTLKLDDEASLNAVYDYYTRTVIPSEPFARPEQFADVISVAKTQSDKLKNFDVNRFIDNSYVQSAVNRGLNKG